MPVCRPQTPRQLSFAPGGSGGSLVKSMTKIRLRCEALLDTRDFSARQRMLLRWGRSIWIRAADSLALASQRTQPIPILRIVVGAGWCKHRMGREAITLG